MSEATEGALLDFLNSKSLSAQRIHDRIESPDFRDVGLRTGQSILEHRAVSGPFESIEQLLDVPGIGPSTLEKMVAIAESWDRVSDEQDDRPVVDRLLEMRSASSSTAEIAHDSGLDEATVIRVIRSLDLGAELSLDPVAAVALLNETSEDAGAELARLTDEEAAERLDRAQRDGLVGDVDKESVAVDLRRLRKLWWTSVDNPNHTLLTIGLGENRLGRLSTAWAADPASLAGRALHEYPGLKAAEARRIEQAGLVTGFAGGDTGVLTALTSSGLEIDVALIAAWNNDDLASALATDGRSEGEAVNLARAMRARARSAFPMIALRADSHWHDDVELTARLDRLLRPHPDLDLYGESVQQYAERTGVRIGEQAQAKLVELQRQLTIAPTWSELRALRSTGIGSAHEVVVLSLKGFAARVGDDLDSDQVAQIWARATRVHTMSLGLVSMAHADFAGATPRVMKGPNESGAELADWAELFGSLDHCACEHCRSISGPAAYLTDLLHWIDGSVGSPADVLVGLEEGTIARRPDIGYLDLNCENAMTPMPYIDLVLEILENAVAFDQELQLPHRSYQTTMPADDLRIIAEHRHDSVYARLLTAVRPWTLPFDVWLEYTRRAVAGLGTTRRGLLELANPGAAFVSEEIAAEVLGIMPPVRGGKAAYPGLEWDIIAGKRAAQAAWGLSKSEWAEAGGQVVGLVEVREAMRLAGLDFEQFTEVLGSRFVNPKSVDGDGGAAVTWVDDRCTLDSAKLMGFDRDVADRFHRFTRLRRVLAVSTDELDAILEPFGVLDEPTLVSISHAARITEMTRLTLVEVAALWGPMQTAPVMGSLYDRLFVALADVEPRLSLNAARTELDSPSPLADLVPALAAALKTSTDEVDEAMVAAGLMVPAGMSLPSSVAVAPIAAISAIYRRVLLAQALDLSVDELNALIDVTGLDPFDATNTTDAVQFVVEADRLAALGLSPTAVAHLLGVRVASSVEDAALRTAVDELQVELRDRRAVHTSALADAAAATSATVAATTALQATLEADATASFGSDVDTIVTNWVAGTTGCTSDLSVAMLSGLAEPGGALYRKVLGALAEPAPSGKPSATPPVGAGQVAAFDRAVAALEVMRKLTVAFRLTGAPDADVEWVLGHDVDRKWIGWISPGAFVASTPARSAAETATLGVPGSTSTPLPVPDGYSRFRSMLEAYAGARALDAPELSPLALFGRVKPKAALKNHAGDVSIATGWAQGLVAEVTGVGSLSDLDHLATKRAALTAAGLSADDAATLAARPAAAVAMHAQALLRARSGEGWPDIARPIHDKLRETRRDALVAHLMEREGLDDPAALYARYLIDVEMSACAITSRIKLAISSVQLFIQRCLLGLEGPQLQQAIDKPQWEWRKNYRVWEANRKVFLYPENWLYPDMRLDESSIFRDVVEQLEGGELTDSATEGFVASYLSDLAEVAHLRIVGACRESEAIYGTPSTRATYHVIGRTKSAPYKHFYRTWVHEPSGTTYWTPWEQVDIEIDSEHVVPVFHQRRLWIFWPVIVEKSGRPTGHDGAVPYHEVRLAWTCRVSNGWQRVKISGDAVAAGPFTSPERQATGVLDDKLLAAAPPQPVSTTVATGPPTYSVTRIRFTADIGDNGLDAGRPVFVWLKFKGGSTRHVKIGHDRWKQDTSISYDPTTTAFDPAELVEVGFKNASSFGVTLDSYTVAVDIGPTWAPVGTATPGKIKGGDLTTTSASFSPDLPPPPEQPDAAPVAWPVDTDPSRWFFLSEADPMNDDLVIRLLRAHPLGADHLPEWAYVAESRFRFMAGDESVRVEPVSASSSSEVLQEKWNWRYQPENLVVKNQQLVPLSLEQAGSNRFNSKVKNTTVVLMNNSGPSWKNFYERVTLFGHAPRNYAFLGLAEHPNLNGVDVCFYDDDLLSAVIEPVSQYKMPHDNAVSTWRNGLRYRVTRLSHPNVAGFRSALAANGPDALLGLPNVAGQTPPQERGESTSSLEHLAATTRVLDPLPKDGLQFSWNQPFGVYNSELFFHLPMVIADRLRQAGKFEEALHWMHYIFDPLGDEGETGTGQYWNYLPFKTAATTPICELMKLVGSAAGTDVRAQIDRWEQRPFAPHVIAQMRPAAYMKNVVMTYLDILIAWADELFRRDTIESINESTQIYLLASEILGERPTTIDRHDATETMTYRELRVRGIDRFGNALIAAEGLLAGNGVALDDPDEGAGTRPTVIGSLYFCIPDNPQMIEYWDTIADRLFKIRHCMNIEGTVRQLALYEPPIDPALLVKATAAGLDLGQVISDLYAPWPKHRFALLHQRAMTFANEVRSLGQSLLSALEKRDGEQLARLRTQHEVSVLDAATAIRRFQITEAKAQIENLKRARELAEFRHDEYASREYRNDGERNQMMLQGVGKAWELESQGSATVAALLGAIPDFEDRDERCVAEVRDRRYGAEPLIARQRGRTNQGDAGWHSELRCEHGGTEGVARLAQAGVGLLGGAGRQGDRPDRSATRRCRDPTRNVGARAREP